jgi:hypothetical protein
VFVPTLGPRVRVLDALPFALVVFTTVVVLVVPSVPPPAVTANVTALPKNGLSFPSRTSTTNGLPNAVLITPCCPSSPEILTSVVAVGSEILTNVVAVGGGGGGGAATASAVKATP